MRTELICVGTELLAGKLNTDCAYIGERLSAVGLDLRLVTTVGDDAKEMGQAFRGAIARSTLVVVTGGLGPTFDDLTRETLAGVLGRRLVFQKEVLDAIRARFAARGTAMPENNERQAFIIDGARVLPNRHGTAPGQLIEIKDGALRAVIILLPGPPKELQLMFESEVFPYIRRFETVVKKSFVLHVAGMAESAVDEKIRPVIETERRMESGKVDFTILARPGIIDVKASVWGDDELLVDELLNNLKREFFQALGDNIFGEGKQTLESVAGELLFKNSRTLAVAESCTGGLLAHRVTNIPGSSRYFLEGVVTYANEAKTALLGVDPRTLENFGAVSEQTALEMARGVKKSAGSDYAVSITGIAGPGGGTPEKPVGLVYIGIASPAGATASCYQFPGDRATIRERAALQALDLLRRQLLKEDRAKTPKHGKTK